MCADCGYPGDVHYSLGVAYPADRTDGHGDFMKANTVRETAWGFIAKGAKVGLMHADGTEGHGQVAESYIYQGPDWATAGADGNQQVIKAGDWLVGVLWDAPTWRLIKTGRFTGWSIQGTGTRRPLDEGEADG